MAAVLTPPVATASHRPVLLDRVVELLAAPSGPGVLVDATLGAGGHAAALLRASADDVHLLGIDRDGQALEVAAQRLAAFGDRVHLVRAPFDELSAHVDPLLAVHGPLLGVLFDLGVSSMQLDTGARGFSFRADAPLDMRMDPREGETAAELLDRVDEGELVAILRGYGEERHARRIARAILAARPLRSTAALAEVVLDALPAAVRRTSATHPATRTFQALRIAVNGELDRFSASLPQALERLGQPATPSAAQAERPRGGRIAVLSYHSLEDRIAKRTFAEAARGCICPPEMPVCGCGRTPDIALLTRGAERPTEDEVAANPRARSARLRAAERLVHV